MAIERYCAKSGKILWHWRFDKPTAAGMCATPVVLGDRLLVSAAQGTANYVQCLEMLSTDDGGLQPKLIYENDRLLCNQYHTPSVLDGAAYGFGRGDNADALQCLDVTSGKLLWQREGAEWRKDRQLTLADGLLFALTTRDELVLADARKDMYKELARFNPGIKLGIQQQPVISNNRLYLRGDDTIVCYQVVQRNGTGTEKAPPSRAIGSGGTMTMTAGFENRTFIFLDGDLNYAEFQKAVAGKRAQPVDKTLPQALQFPAGTYKATLTARFPNAVELDADTTPVWKYDAIVSNAVEVTFAPLKPEDAGSITGLVVGSDGKPFPDAEIAFYRANNFSSPPVTGSGNAVSIANRPDPPTPPIVRPGGIFGGGGGGTPAGTSDADGAFAIKNLAPGTYIVTVRKSDGTGRGLGGGFEGSLQPIEVKAGSETKLDQPVKALSTSETNRGRGQ